MTNFYDNINSASTPLKGYIEGYYGKILSWEDRERILIKLEECNMNAFLYAPKEDLFHRKKWRKSYDKFWLDNFKKFCVSAKNRNIRVIIGIAPGLDFNFLSLKNESQNSDYKILKKKIQIFFLYGADFVNLMLDDIPNNFTSQFSSFSSEGKMHASLLSNLYLEFQKKIMFTPRIYANELKIDSPEYIKDIFYNSSNINNYFFYCGKNIVEERLTKNSFKEIPKKNLNKLIIWDNTYANDYCPRKLIIKPFKNKQKSNNMMFNLTGLIETDLLLIEIIKNTQHSKKPYLDFKSVLMKNKIPYNFLNIFKYFFVKNYKKTLKINKILYDLDCLLWEYKSPILLEWYPYIMGLKQDLLIENKLITSNRLNKISTQPLRNVLKNYL